LARLLAPEFHDAHGVGRLAVIRQDELGNPKITVTVDSVHDESLFARLFGARDLYVGATADALARLWVFQHRIRVIDRMLGFKVVDIGCGPMPIQCGTDLLVSHRILLRRQPAFSGTS
jgi:hypothetical protein